MKPIQFFFILLLVYSCQYDNNHNSSPDLHFDVMISDNINDSFQVNFTIKDHNSDSLELSLPVWMPGYYQTMGYSENITDFSACSVSGEELEAIRFSQDTWIIPAKDYKDIKVSYTVKTSRKFVAATFIDSLHAYIIPGSAFLYSNDLLQNPVTVQIHNTREHKDIVTGLKKIPDKPGLFYAVDFDILYDCPILIGELEELEPFNIDGVEHHWVGYQMSDFDRDKFMFLLERVVQASIDVIGDIPYEKYTFIGIGPAAGGIEHLNNTTVSFRGINLESEKSANGTLAFLAHEYFHNFNVKRIRPFELGPFDYSRENRTNLLWVSEGFTVYYEYLILRRAGIIDQDQMLDYFAGFIGSYENDRGKTYQTLQEASYTTWDFGPFGGRGTEDRSISVYDKGAIIGLLLDLEIRHSTDNASSLDDVMRRLYYYYYKELDRGFTDAEFQSVCEDIAGKSLNDIFEYVYSTKEINYKKYLDYAGLKLSSRIESSDRRSATSIFSIRAVNVPNNNQKAVLSGLGIQR